MRHFEVVVEPGLDGRPVRELGLRPDAEDGGGEDMRARMPEAFEVRHGIALVERLAIFRFCCCWLLIFFGHKIYSATKALRTPSGNNLPLHWLCELCVSVAIILVNKNAPDLRSEASAFISSGDER